MPLLFSISTDSETISTGVLFGHYDYSSSTKGMKIAYDYGINELFWGSGSGGPRLWSGQLPLGNWYHIAATMDNNGNAELYVHDVNGDLITMQGATDSGYAITETSNNFTVGAMYDANHFFEGKIDDLRIYDRVLAENEIGELVPEPATLSLLALGGLAVMRRKQPR